MKVCVIGTRGFPHIQGGVEKHCESIYPLLCRMGVDITVFRRKPYINSSNSIATFDHVKFRDVVTSRNKNFEALLHSFFCALICVHTRPDIVHIHNIGPALVLPLLKLSKLKTVVTYHSANYEQAKWGKVASSLLKLGEFLTYRLSDEVIFVTKARYRDSRSKKKNWVANGVFKPTKADSDTYIRSMNLTPKKYIVVVTRLSPEKGLDILIQAYLNSDLDLPLVIAGGSDHHSDYGKKLKLMASGNQQIQFTGYITGEKLNEVYSHAGFFVLPSFNEGLPIAVLEAIAYGLPVLVSNIQPNKELNLPEECYFQCGDVDDLIKKLKVYKKKMKNGYDNNVVRNHVLENYDWSVVARKTMMIYEKLCNSQIEKRYRVTH